MRIATGFHVDPSQVFVTAGGKGVMAYANLIEALGRIRARVEPLVGGLGLAWRRP